MFTLDLSALSFEQRIAREWLVPNGAGGYASSTIIGLNTRKYHGLLVTASRPPFERMVILSRVEETVSAGGRTWALATVEYPGAIHPSGHELIRAFDAHPHPRWAFQGEGWTLQKTLRFVPGRPDAVVLTYTLLGAAADVELTVKPLLALRPIHELMYQWSGRLEAEISGEGGRYVRIPGTARTPAVHLAHEGKFVAGAHWYLSTLYRCERDRGYAGMEDLWMPGEIRFSLSPGRSVHIAVSTRELDLASIEADLAREDEQQRRPAGARGGVEEVTRALATAAERFFVWSAPSEGEPWTCLMPQYPWTPWSVRDMLISLPGILLAHGRFVAARTLLVKLAGMVREGLVPSELGERGEPPAYNASDVSLWFIHAAGCYVRQSQDEQFASQVLPVARGIIGAYQRGTRLGIGLDGEGLLRVREPGIGTTWMNAKVGEWVITPRHGRPVEVNALWHNALCVVAEWHGLLRDEKSAEGLRSVARSFRREFNERFWNSAAKSCFDVVYDSGADAAIRPNQLLAVSLTYPALSEDRWRGMLATVREKLLTPVGLRTLSPDDASYQGHYGGDVVKRDRAYHQGSVFPWLLGPYATAVFRAHGRSEATLEEIRRALAGCLDYLRGDGMGVLPELFDGDAPHAPGGAVADARSVGEIARVWNEVMVAPANSRLPNAGRTPQLVQ